MSNGSDSMSTMRKNDNMEIYHKTVKVAHDRANHQTFMVYLFEKDPNLCCRLDKMKLHLTIDIPNENIPDNGFGAKLFNRMRIYFDSQLVNESKSV